ncbi:MAG: Hsp20/alpha crystallin family protein [Candidatus Hydrogenedentota bacterium]
MSLVRCSNGTELAPWNALRDIENHFNRIFGEGWPEFSSLGKRSWVPAIDLRENENAYVVDADMPGLKKEDIHLEVIDNVLTVRGERKESTEHKDKNVHRVERSYGSFQRSIDIPGGFEGDKVEAKFEDGVLRVTLPKRAELRPRQIKVEAK